MKAYLGTLSTEREAQEFNRALRNATHIISFVQREEDGKVYVLSRSKLAIQQATWFFKGWKAHVN